MKSKNVFDHANHILKYQNSEYYNMLDESDRATFSTFMINRILSFVKKFNFILIPAISEMDEIITKSKLPPNIAYLLYINNIPKSNLYEIQYQKSTTSESKYTSDLITIFSEYLQISKNTAISYLDMYYKTKDGKSYVIKILESHGLDKKEIQKIMKCKTNE